jgi:hypothetical protein
MPRKIAQIERLEPHLETQMQMTARNRGRPSASRRKLLPSASSSAFIRGIPVRFGFVYNIVGWGSRKYLRPEGNTVMTQNRRDFINSSIAMTLLTISKASAQGGQPRRIGIVSTGFNDEFEACFLQALKDDGWEKQPTSLRPIVVPGATNAPYGGSIGHSALRNAVRAHVTTHGAHLIVAVGGNITQASAWEALINIKRPFVYLSGRLPQTPMPPPPPGKYCGVVLNTSAQYKEAVKKFGGLGIDDPSTVWLVQNRNSEESFVDGEYSDWVQQIGNTNRFLFFDPPPQANNAAQYPSEVSKLRSSNPSLKGVVVSPDSYFRLTAEAFTNAMNSFSPRISICYPFKDFNPSFPDFLLPNRPTLSSANSLDRNNAYYQLGDRAADVLNNSTVANPIPSLQLDSKIWDGSAWTTI